MTGSADDHPLAVEAHDEAQRAVGRRVLRPEVEDHVAGVELDVDLRVGEVAQRARVDAGSRAAAGLGGAHVAASVGSASASASSPSPGIGSTSTRPGHGFTTRASSGKSLRSG